MKRPQLRASLQGTPKDSINRMRPSAGGQTSDAPPQSRGPEHEFRGTAHSGLTSGPVDYNAPIPEAIHDYDLEDGDEELYYGEEDGSPQYDPYPRTSEEYPASGFGSPEPRHGDRAWQPGQDEGFDREHYYGSSAGRSPGYPRPSLGSAGQSPPFARAPELQGQSIDGGEIYPHVDPRNGGNATQETSFFPGQSASVDRTLKKPALYDGIQFQPRDEDRFHPARTLPLRPSNRNQGAPPPAQGLPGRPRLASTINQSQQSIDMPRPSEIFGPNTLQVGTQNNMSIRDEQPQPDEETYQNYPQYTNQMMSEEEDPHERAPRRRGRAPDSSSPGTQPQYGMASSGWTGAGPSVAHEAPYWQLGAPQLNRSSTFDEQEFYRNDPGFEQKFGGESPYARYTLPPAVGGASGVQESPFPRRKRPSPEYAYAQPGSTGTEGMSSPAPVKGAPGERSSQPFRGRSSNYPQHPMAASGLEEPQTEYLEQTAPRKRQSQSFANASAPRPVGSAGPFRQTAPEPKNRFSVPARPRHQKTQPSPPVGNDELDFMGEGFAPSIPEDVEDSCNATLERISRSVQRAAAYVDMENDLDQVPEREDLSSDGDGQSRANRTQNDSRGAGKSGGRGSFLLSLGRSIGTSKPKSGSPPKQRGSFQERMVQETMERSFEAQAAGAPANRRASKTPPATRSAAKPKAQPKGKQNQAPAPEESPPVVARFSDEAYLASLPPVGSPNREARPQSKSPPKDKDNVTMPSPTKQMAALNKASREAVADGAHSSPTWTWLAGKLNEDSPQSPQQEEQPRQKSGDRGQRGRRVQVRDVECEAHQQPKAQGEPDDADAIFANALEGAQAGKATYEQAMQEIWGGGGEATGLTAAEYRDELFEKAAQRIFTDTSYSSIIRNLVHLSGQSRSPQKPKLEKIPEQDEGERPSGGKPPRPPKGQTKGASGKPAGKKAEQDKPASSRSGTAQKVTEQIEAQARRGKVANGGLDGKKAAAEEAPRPSQLSGGQSPKLPSMLPDDIHAPPAGAPGKSHNTPTFSAQKTKGTAGKMFPPNEGKDKPAAAPKPGAAPSKQAGAGAPAPEMMRLAVPTRT